MTEMCNFSADILMGHSNADQCATVRRLMDVLNDDTKVSELATQLSEEPSKWFQFLTLVNFILNG